MAVECGLPRYHVLGTWIERQVNVVTPYRRVYTNIQDQYPCDLLPMFPPYSNLGKNGLLIVMFLFLREVVALSALYYVV